MNTIGKVIGSLYFRPREGWFWSLLIRWIAEFVYLLSSGMPIDERIKGSQRLLEIRKGGASWFIQRLGRGFVRDAPTPDEVTQKLLRSAEPNPLENKLCPRPLNFSSPALLRHDS